MSHMGLNMKNVPGLVFVCRVYLHIAAYSAEIMRSSIDAVAPGEKEAAKSLGMTEFQSYAHHLAAGFHHEHSTVDEPRYRHVERDGAHL